MKKIESNISIRKGEGEDIDDIEYKYITEEQFDLIKEFLPDRESVAGKTRKNNRLFLDALTL